MQVRIKIIQVRKKIPTPRRGHQVGNQMAQVNKRFQAKKKTDRLEKEAPHKSLQLEQPRFSDAGGFEGELALEERPKELETETDSSLKVPWVP